MNHVFNYHFVQTTFFQEKIAANVCLSESLIFNVAPFCWRSFVGSIVEDFLIPIEIQHDRSPHGERQVRGFVGFEDGFCWFELEISCDFRRKQHLVG